MLWKNDCWVQALQLFLRYKKNEYIVLVLLN